MGTSFFGGDPSMSHFSVSVRYRAYKGEPESEARERRKAEREKLKAKGVKETTYFQYRNDDKKGKTAAMRNANAEADRIRRVADVDMEVCEGCFL